MKKQLISGLIVLMMLVTVIPAGTDAGDYPVEEYSITVENTRQSEKGYPSSLDLRDQGLVTSVKSQGNFGTCWAHAVISCIETSLINGGYADNSIDLSELHLAYYMTNMSADPLGGNEGDTVKLESYLNSGSIENYALSAVLESWRGAVLEEDVPYYEASPELVLDPSYEYGYTSYIVTDVQFINGYDRGAMKEILNGGNSLTIGYYASDNDALNVMYDGDVRTVSYCITGESPIMNHCVTVIGYDDDYPKENFSNVPEADGAWLVKNSWGTESTRVGSDGCFWLSYYCTGLETCFAFTAVPADTYDLNYGYDGGGSMHQNISFGNEGYMANIFTASSDEFLGAVSFYVMEPGTSFEVEVYRNLSDPADPASGELIAYSFGSADHPGYYTVNVDTAELCKGDTFSVVIGLSNQDRDVELSVDTSVDAIDPAIEGVWAEVRTSAKEGQSFVSSDGGSWTDIGKDGMSNVRVRAFTDVIVTQETAPLGAMILIAAMIIAITAAAMIRTRND